MTYYMKGGNPNDCSNFPFCDGNSACNSGKCDDPPGASIDNPIAQGMLVFGILLFIYVLHNKVKNKIKQ